MNERRHNELLQQFRTRKPAEPSAIRHILERLARDGAARVAMHGVKPAAMAEAARRVASMIDHTALKPDTSTSDVDRLCEEAARYGFGAVCVNPCFVSLASAILDGTDVNVCTVAGFPLGASRPETKAEEATFALDDGATEIDMVINVGMLKSDQHDFVEADIRAVVDTVQARGGTTKVILETSLLSDEEKVIACLLACAAGADFVKTSTGFSSGGATAADVALMRRTVGDEMGVKASGGIRSADDAARMIDSGATRIGASASVRIING